MGFHEILCPRPSPAPEDSYCIIIQDYLSVVSRRFYPSIMYIMSQSPPSYLRIDTLSPSAPTCITQAVCTWRSSVAVVVTSFPCKTLTSSTLPFQVLNVRLYDNCLSCRYHQGQKKRGCAPFSSSQPSKILSEDSQSIGKLLEGFYPCLR